MLIILGDIISAIVGTADIIASNAVKYYRYCQGPRLIMLRMLQHQPHWKTNPKWEFGSTEEVCGLLQRERAISNKSGCKDPKSFTQPEMLWYAGNSLKYCFHIICLSIYPSIYLSVLPFLPISLSFSLYSAQDYSMSDNNFFSPSGSLQFSSFKLSIRGLWNNINICILFFPFILLDFYCCPQSDNDPAELGLPSQHSTALGSLRARNSCFQLQLDTARPSSGLGKVITCCRAISASGRQWV